MVDNIRTRKVTRKNSKNSKGLSRNKIEDLANHFKKKNEESKLQTTITKLDPQQYLAIGWNTH